MDVWDDKTVFLKRWKKKWIRESNCGINHREEWAIKIPGKGLLRPSITRIVCRSRQIVSSRSQRRKVRVGKTKDQKMVVITRDVWTTQTNQQKIPKTKSDRPVHQLSMGRRHGEREIVHERQWRVRILSPSHRRFLAFHTNVPAQNYPSQRNGSRLEFAFWRRSETQETEDR